MKYKIGDVLVLKNGRMATVLYVNENLKSYHIEVRDYIPGWGHHITDVKENEIHARTPPPAMMAQ